MYQQKYAELILKLKWNGQDHHQDAYPKKKQLVICLKYQISKANTVTEKAGYRYQQLQHLPLLSILSTLRKQQNSNLNRDEGV